jgi:SAM-dependent methyltransferase
VIGRRRSRRRQWDDRWGRADFQPPWLYEEVRPQVEAAQESGWIPAGASVVDLGCGLGHTSAWLAARGHRVLAMDISNAAIERARALHDMPGLTLRRADVSRRLRGATTHDVVLDLGCLHQLPARVLPQYRANIRRLTRPGSRLLLILRIRAGDPGAPTVDGRAGFVGGVLGPGFELDSAAPLELPWNGDLPGRPGAEVRFVRRS